MKARLKTISFKETYNPEPSKTFYIHNISFDNGDVGIVYLKDKMPERCKEGVECEYYMAGDRVKDFKVVKEEQPKTENNMEQPKNTYNSSASFAVSYAKDIVVAKIMAKEKGLDAIEEIKKISSAIYEHIQELNKK